MARRSFEVFSLSFLDVICCGFGAVILFYTIVSAQSGLQNSRRNDVLAAQVAKLDEEVTQGRERLVLLRNAIRKTESETASASSRASVLIEQLRTSKEESSSYDQTTLAKRERIEKLKTDVSALQENSRRLEASAKVASAQRGDRVGSGKNLVGRRYITGLALKGRRVLVLLDRSGSMLDDDLVNIIRLRNMPSAAQLSAPKWRRAVDITSWVISELPAGAQYQVYGFNSAAAPVLAGTAGQWLSVDDDAQRAKVLDGLGALVPREGTSLFNALKAIREMQLPPDQVLLITDGLPTQGATPPALRRTVDAAGRVRLFDEAVRGINRNLPIDVVLLPMKGDVQAAHRFWGLARLTKGSFVMPSPDWP